MSDLPQTTLADYLRMLRRYRLFIALVAVACGAAALAYSLLQDPTYEATASLNVHDPAQDLNLVGAGGYTGQTGLQIASAHAPQVTRAGVIRRVKKDLRSPETINQIRSQVSAQVDPNSYLVEITAQAPGAAGAARIANAVARVDAKLSSKEARQTYAAQADRLAARIKALNGTQSVAAQAIYATRLSTLQSLATVASPVKVSDAAEVPTVPSSPKPVRNTAAAVIFGLLLGMALAYGRRAVDRRLRDPSRVEKVLDLPVAARLRMQAFGHTGALTEASNGRRLDPVDEEAFRRLRENVRYLAPGGEIRTLAVTSAIPEEGKSTVAACLAAASASAGAHTLLVECDLRKRVLAGRFGIAESPGLSDFLVGQASPQEILQLVPVPPAAAANGSRATSLVCITAGFARARPADLLSSTRFADFLRQVGQAYDQVIIDCPPLLPVADTLEIVPHAAGVLLCVRLNRTKVDQLEAARQALERLPGRPAGVVITDFTERKSDAYLDYYEYAPRKEAEAPAGDTADRRRSVAQAAANASNGVAPVTTNGAANANNGSTSRSAVT